MKALKIKSVEEIFPRLPLYANCVPVGKQQIAVKIRVFRCR